MITHSHFEHCHAHIPTHAAIPSSARCSICTSCAEAPITIGTHADPALHLQTSNQNQENPTQKWSLIHTLNNAMHTSQHTVSYLQPHPRDVHQSTTNARQRTDPHRIFERKTRWRRRRFDDARHKQRRKHTSSVVTSERTIRGLHNGTLRDHHQANPVRVKI